MPDEVMVALTEHRISLLLDLHAGQLVRPGQLAAANCDIFGPLGVGGPQIGFSRDRE